MIRLNKGGVSDQVILTLTEAITLSNPYLLFIFNNDTTREEVKFILSLDDDKSNNTDRYNRFVFNTSIVFYNLPPGDYKYQVYEQASNINLNPDGLLELENGKMQLIGEQTGFIENDFNITFIQNNG